MEASHSLHSNEILELVFKYLTKMSSLKKHDDIVSVLADMGRALTNSDRCSVWVVSDDRKLIWTKVAHGIDPIKIPISTGIVGSAIVNNERIVINDAYQDSRFHQDVDKHSGYITKSMIVIPLTDNEGEVIGAFQAINHRDSNRVFDNRDIERLMLASTYAAETLESAKLSQELEDTQKEVIFSMGAIGETRSKETGYHVKRVAEYSKLFAKKIGLSKKEINLIQIASPMHDIGKVAIPDNILNKPGKLTDDEFIVMKKHANLGYAMLNHSSRPILKAAAIIASQHHEKWDGTGYPEGLKGQAIHIYGRITSIADVFDALGSERCYKNAWPDEEIFNLIKSESGKMFDPELVQIFFDNLESFLEIRDSYKDDL
ncbi:MAG: HD domain-containing protein [Gammaproteobacteria bacterium]|nr:HD domain-containing protein [Gammaproteobacteria bacterium]